MFESSVNPEIYFIFQSAGFGSSFKFRKIWLSNDQFLILRCFLGSFRRCPVTSLFNKPKVLKYCLKSWNKEVFGNIFQNISNCENKVKYILSLLHNNEFSYTIHSHLDQSREIYENLLLQEEVFWRQKLESNGLLKQIKIQKIFSSNCYR